MVKKMRRIRKYSFNTELRECYLLGYDCGYRRATDKNKNHSIFSSKNRLIAWQRGREDGREDKRKERQKRKI